MSEKILQEVIDQLKLEKDQLKLEKEELLIYNHILDTSAIELAEEVSRLNTIIRRIRRALKVNKR